jgi:type II secretion system protein J
MSGQRHFTTRGFTLMEVMLALAVSAILLAAIGGIFFSAARLRERTTSMLDEALPMHQAIALLRRDLRGALPPGPGALPLAGDFKCEALGGGIAEEDRLTLFTSSGSLNGNDPWSDIQEIVYELRDPVQRTTGPGKDFVRSVYRNLLTTGAAEPDDQLLMSNVQSLSFECFDGQNWVNTWDTSLSNTNLPVAVRVKILPSTDPSASIGAAQPYELLVPLLSQSRTNSLVSTNSAG